MSLWCSYIVEIQLKTLGKKSAIHNVYAPDLRQTEPYEFFHYTSTDENATKSRPT